MQADALCWSCAAATNAQVMGSEGLWDNSRGQVCSQRPLALILLAH